MYTASRASVLPKCQFFFLCFLASHGLRCRPVDPRQAVIHDPQFSIPSIRGPFNPIPSPGSMGSIPCPAPKVSETGPSPPSAIMDRRKGSQELDNKQPVNFLRCISITIGPVMNQPPRQFPRPKPKKSSTPKPTSAVAGISGTASPAPAPELMSTGLPG